jgi:putative peptidoglycan lipid II flippase
VAGIAQLLWVAFAAHRIGFTARFKRPRLTPGVKRLLWLAAPAAAAGGITQINLFIGQIIASTKEGAIAVLQYADRVYQLPLGVVGIAIGVVLLPELARALKAGHQREAQHNQNRALEFALFLTLPAATALAIIAVVVVRVLYERGAFLPETTDTTSRWGSPPSS